MQCRLVFTKSDYKMKTKYTPKINVKLIYRILSIAFILLIIALSFDAMARPGGGNSYSSGSGSGGGGDDSFLFDLIIFILLELPPEISIPLVIIIIVIAIIRKKRQNRINQRVVVKPTYEVKRKSVESLDGQIENLKQSDNSFSKVVFLDFVTSLYIKFYSTLGKKQFAELVPFLSNGLFNEMQASANSKKETITEIVIGNILISKISINEQTDSITVEIKSNYTSTIQNRRSRYIIDERWMLSRRHGVLSLEPEAMRKLACPNCGAPATFTQTGHCEYCNTFISSGEIQWCVENRKLIRVEVLDVDSLVAYSQEVGTDFPTVKQQNLASNTSRFINRNKLPAWDSYWADFKNGVAAAYFREIYTAWTLNKLDQIRHLLSDRQYDSFGFWIQTYKQNGYTNRLDNVKISNIDLARVEVDKYYDSITVRIFASCNDYTVNKEGKVIGGSQRTARHFSEYWTFIQRTGIEKNAKDVNLKNCPNCGAPADKMGQAAVCEYCGAKISNGDFSWVLAIITQDEVYSG